MAMTHALTLPPGWIISSRLVPAWQIDADHLLEVEAAGRTDEGRIRWRYRLSRLAGPFSAGPTSARGSALF
jgi:hypothetical protein